MANYMRYQNEATKQIQLAISFDKAGNFSEASRCYRAAIPSLTLYLQNAPEGESKKVMEKNKTDCERRIQELNAMKTAAPVVSGSGGAAQKSRPPPGGPPGSTGRSGSGGGGGGGSGAKQDPEASEFASRMEGAILREKPNIHWDDVAGLGEAKRNLIQAVILPMKLPQFFTNGRTPWRGILLYGPPGTGKSFLAKACATEAEGATFLTVSTSDLMSKWLGESEKLIQALFDAARKETKAVIFIDEIDSLLSERSDQDSEASRRIKTQFLIEIDGVGKSMDGILLLAATNTPWALDPAVRRRFEKKIYIPLPDKEARIGLIRLKTKGMESQLTEQDILTIADWTEGYSGADINILSRDAAMAPVNAIQQAEYFVEYEGNLFPCNSNYPGAVRTTVLELSPEQLARLKPSPLTIRDFEIAIQKVRPSVAQSSLAEYDKWTRDFGQQGD
jgi:vacuolar protein-sorting-associated protein 4